MCVNHLLSFGKAESSLSISHFGQVKFLFDLTPSWGVFQLYQLNVEGKHEVMLTHGYDTDRNIIGPTMAFRFLACPKVPNSSQRIAASQTARPPVPPISFETFLRLFKCISKNVYKNCVWMKHMFVFILTWRHFARCPHGTYAIYKVANRKTNGCGFHQISGTPAFQSVLIEYDTVLYMKFLFVLVKSGLRVWAVICCG